MTPDEPIDTDRPEGSRPDPAELETVRRLLAAAARDESGAPPRMPADVAARLDGVLAELGRTRDAAPADATETNALPEAADELAARRDARASHSASPPIDAGSPARRWPKLLVAAAAVTVLGVGLGNVVDDLGGVGGMAGSGGSAGDSEALTEEAPAGGGEAASEARVRVEAAAPTVAQGRALSQAEDAPTEQRVTPEMTLTRLRSDSLRRDAQRVADATLPGRTRSAAERDQGDPGQGGQAPPTRQETRRPSIRCERPPTRPGDAAYAALLDGRRAVLVFRAPRPEGSGARVVDVYACDDTDTALASTVVDVR